MRTTLTFLVVLAGLSVWPASAVAGNGRLVVSVYPDSDPYSNHRILELVDPDTGAAQTFVDTGPATGQTDASWNRDASKIAYFDFQRGFYIKTIADNTEKPLPVPDTARNPSLSRASDELAYWLLTYANDNTERWTLRVLPLDGSPTRTIAGPFIASDVKFPNQTHQPAWSGDGKSIAFWYKGAIVSMPSVPVAGGQMTTLVPASPDGKYFVYQPSFSPDGKRLAYVKRANEPYPAVPPFELIVRVLESGAETTVAQRDPTATPPGAQWLMWHGPQSWSPNSKQIAYGWSHACSEPCESDLNVVNVDGSGHRTVHNRTFVVEPAWSPGGPGPSYFIRDVEVSQPISAYLDPPLPFDPLLADPYTIHWTQKAPFGYALPLVAGKSTLLRVYVGDASLLPESSARRTIKYSVVDTGTGVRFERSQEVEVTAPESGLRAAQETEVGALNVWLPPESASPAGTHSFSIEVNVNETEPECGGCYPNGNRATVPDVRTDDGGRVVVAPVPVFEIAPDSRTVIVPDEATFRAALTAAVPMLPIPDDGLSFVQSPGSLLVEARDLTLDDGCSTLLAKLLELRAEPGIAGPVAGAGATRWVAFGPPVVGVPGATVCVGRAQFFSTNVVLRGATSERFAHEFGHSLGLTHASGRSTNPVPAGAFSLPYDGIGGVGYALGAGAVTEIFRSVVTGDLMSYDVETWTSPRTWQYMWQKILAETGAIATPSGAAARGRTATVRAAAKAPVVRRLVSGIVAGDKTRILHSYVAATTLEPATGPIAARVVGLDARGKTVARGEVHGTPFAEVGQKVANLPFLVALPNKASITSIVLLPTRGTKPLARVKASRHAPKGRLLKLPRRASATKPLSVRWTASDRDRRDKLSVALLARRGRGKWRTLTLGPARGKLAVDPRALGTGKSLTVRLRITDGFRTTVVTGRKIAL